MATIDVKDAADLTVAIEKPLVPGRAAAASSRPVATSNEDFAELQGTNTATTAINTRVGIVTEAAPATDTASSGLNGRLQRVAQRLTSLIALVPAALGSAAAAASLAVTQSTEDVARAGIITETAPATDTASSGLNGRLQRIAQRLTSLIALVPAALGRLAAAASLSVTVSTEDKAVLDAISAPFVPTATATLTALASSTASAQLLASTAGRRGLILYNTDANAVLIKYGTTAAATSFTVRIDPDGYWEMPLPIYTGRIDAIWEADGTGSLYATEL